MDCLISDVLIGRKRVYNNKWSDILCHLFSRYSSINKNRMDKYDPYIYSTFESFVKAKKKLKFTVNSLIEHADPRIRDMIMHRVIKTYTETLDITKREQNDNANPKVRNAIKHRLIMTDVKSVSMKNGVDFIKREQSDIKCRNLFKKELLNIFVNVNTIIIVLEYGITISLLDLLSIIEPYAVQNVWICFGKTKYKEYIDKFYDLSPEIKQKYSEANYIIYFKRGQYHEYNDDRVWCVIDMAKGQKCVSHMAEGQKCVAALDNFKRFLMILKKYHFVVLIIFGIFWCVY